MRSSHEGLREAIRLRPAKRKRAGTLLCRAYRQRSAAAQRAQHRTLNTHGEPRTVAAARCHRAIQSASGSSLREVLEVRFRSCFCQTSLRIRLSSTARLVVAQSGVNGAALCRLGAEPGDTDPRAPRPGS